MTGIRRAPGIRRARPSGTQPSRAIGAPVVLDVVGAGVDGLQAWRCVLADGSDLEDLPTRPLNLLRGVFPVLFHFFLELLVKEED